VAGNGLATLGDECIDKFIAAVSEHTCLENVRFSKGTLGIMISDLKDSVDTLPSIGKKKKVFDKFTG